MNKHTIKRAVLVFFVCLIVVFGVGYGLANHFFSKLKFDRTHLDDPIMTTQPKTEDDTGTEQTVPATPEENDVSIFLMGTDASGYLTDAMIVINADFSSDTVSMFSIPRDYKIELSKKTQQLIKHQAKYIKMTELHSYAKMAQYESPASLTAAVAEELVALEFDHIVLINLKAFREAVDAIGGVEVYVPRAFNYDDPAQNLHIHLKAGLQLLDGKTAEGLVRFRKSNDGNYFTDFNRIEMQQYFLTEFVKKLISIESALAINELFTIVEDNVKTDADLNDVIALLAQANQLSMSRVFAHTLPGNNAKINGVWYYAPPQLSELHELVAQEIATDRAPTTSSKHLAITLLNGSSKKNIAAKYREILSADGYQVEQIGNASDKGFDASVKTRIYVPDEHLGKDLQAYFPLSEIIYQPSEDAITIVIGKLVED